LNKDRFVKRRNLLYLIALLPTSSFANSISKLFNFFFRQEDSKVITKRTPIDFQWPTQEPFLFCVHHYDYYPPGNKNLDVDSKNFIGRDMGQDFTPKDGFRMYHGSEIPGFPVHPHRGFETITIVRKGYVDHADSLGASGRYGEGDVQWMTAGSGVQHSEMFPLLHQDKPNTCELFQLWLNLPQSKKMVNPDFKMIWANNIPKISKDSKVEVSLICGEYEGKQFNHSPVNSWAKDPANEVNILLVKMDKGGVFKFRGSKNSTHRTLYFFDGNEIKVNGELISSKQALYLDSKSEVVVSSEFSGTELLFLEAKPIGEPIVQHGPFVMNSRQDIFQTIQDYQRTEFGGWNWPRQDMIHGPKVEKFAKYPDGRVERPS
jgi:redox-sensitive bicupin YhaK (pirin superfamily)